MASLYSGRIDHMEKVSAAYHCVNVKTLSTCYKTYMSQISYTFLTCTCCGYDNITIPVFMSNHHSILLILRNLASQKRFRHACKLVMSSFCHCDMIYKLIKLSVHEPKVENLHSLYMQIYTCTLMHCCRGRL